jgi:hypothetical protein
LNEVGKELSNAFQMKYKPFPGTNGATTDISMLLDASVCSAEAAYLVEESVKKDLSMDEGGK